MEVKGCMVLTPTEHPLVDFGGTSFHLSFPTHRDPPPRTRLICACWAWDAIIL